MRRKFLKPLNLSNPHSSISEHSLSCLIKLLDPSQAHTRITTTPEPIMKKLSILAISALAALGLSNCAAPTGPNTQRGAVIGALGGAALGGIVGNQSGRALEGAAIGAAAGGGAGALYGNAQDQEQRRRYNDGY